MFFAKSELESEVKLTFESRELALENFHLQIARAA